MESLHDEVLDVSVVLPVYNEVGHVDDEIERISSALDASAYSYEILVVDDGSTDGSTDHLVDDEHLRVVRFATNRGTGAVRSYGTKAARGRAVAWTDADMSYPNDRIPELVKELEGYDQVVGARTSEQGRLRGLRVPAKFMIRALAQFLTRTRIPDLNSGLRVFRRDVAVQFLSQLPPGFSCVTTMTMTFLANGYSIKNVPIDYAPRAGESKFHWRRDTTRYVTQVLRMVLGYDPLRIFLPLAIALGLLATGKLTYDLLTTEYKVAGNTLLIFFAAFQTFAIGVLADLVVRKSKPADLVDPATL